MIDNKCFIIDDFVPLSYQDYIRDELKNMYGWKYIHSHSGKDLTYNPNDVNIKNSSGFSHLVYDYSKGPISPLFNEIRNIFLFLEQATGIVVDEVYRIKANLSLPICAIKTYNPPHTDVEEEGFFSLVYYVDDSDGETVVFDKMYGEDILNYNIVQTIKPKKGRAVLLKSHQYHASANPINFDTRYVLNFVFRGHKRENK